MCKNNEFTNNEKTGNEELKKVFEIIKFLDESRWYIEKDGNNSRMLNDVEINFSHKDLNEDGKLLTHWLCYITDRGIDYRKCWDIAGFIFSDIIYEIYKNNSQVDEILNMLYCEDTKSYFFDLKKLYNDNNTCIDIHILENKENEIKKQIKKDNNKKNYAFVSKCKNENNKILNDYGFEKNKRVHFTSRFYQADYVSVVYTLVRLRRLYPDSQEMFSDYINDIIHKVEKAYIEKSSEQIQEKLIAGIAYGLYILTYENVKSIENEKLKNIKTIEKDSFENFVNKFKNDEEFIKNMNEFTDKKYVTNNKNKYFKEKRLWCCVRDYIKSLMFGEQGLKQLLLNKQNNKNNEIIKYLYSENTKKYLELPGDVWNNNTIFRKCVFENIESKKALNEFLRKYWENNSNKSDYFDAYPEQFDVTFTFAKNMCANHKCNICPIGLLKGKADKDLMKKLCVKGTEKYCPIVLTTCGYLRKCEGKCTIYEKLK